MPIYLYVKQHSITGLKYFGRTIKNPYLYKGSGTKWRNHIKKHGTNFVETIELYEFQDQEEATKFALEFSEKNQIVESREWANMIVEDATTSGKGRISGFQHSSETKAKMSCSAIGRPRSDETKKKLSRAHIGKKLSVNHKEKIKQSSSGRKLSADHIQKLTDGRRKPTYKRSPHSPETKAKMSEKAKGRIFTEEHKRNLSIAHMKKPISQPH